MKRTICVLLCLTLFAALLGCRSENGKLRQPVNFYYRNSETTYGGIDGLISAQASEGADFEDVTALLNQYLKGPSSNAYQATFPASTKLLSLTVQEDTAYLNMNDALSRLSGIDLTVACACITLTVAELTGVTTVTIRASNADLDGAAVITMNVNALILQDIPLTDENE